MTTIGRRKGVRRYGTAHGLRLSETMDFVCREYAKTVGVSLSDGLRLLLEQAIGQRVNAVEEQAARLGRIEEKVDLVLGRLDAAFGTVEPDDMAVLAEDTPGYGDLLREYYEGSGWE